MREEGFNEISKARQLDPTSLGTNVATTYLLYLTRQFDQAIQQGKKTVELYPELPAAYIWLAFSYEMNGMDDEAIAAHLKSERAWGTTPEALSKIQIAYRKDGMQGYWRYELEAERARGGDKAGDKACWMAELYAHLGEKKRTFEYLNRALKHPCEGLEFLNVNPVYHNLREDPAYQALIARLRLPQASQQ